MFSSFRNFISSHLYRKRSANDDSNEPPSKFVRYTSGSSTADMAEKENQVDDEIDVIAEVRNIEWITPRGVIRKKSPTEDVKSTAAIPSPSFSPGWQAINSHSRRAIHVPDSNGEDEIQIVRSIRHVPIERSGKITKKVSSERSTMKPTRFMQAMKKQHQVPSTIRNMKYLSEKMTYKRLLEMHQTNTLKPFQFTDFKAAKEKKREVQVIDLESDLKTLKVNRSKESQPPRAGDRVGDDIVFLKEKKATSPGLQLRTTFSSLQEYIKLHSITDSYVQQILTDHATNTAEKKRQALLEETKLSVLSAHNKKTSCEALEQQLRDYMKITEPPILEVKDEPEYVLPKLTPEQIDRVTKAMKPTPPQEVLADKFKITITRHDMSTLKGLTWLNDEVINFYMNLLMERGEKAGMPKVYAFNTFFYQNLRKGRLATLKRWTRKVDIFSYDLVLAPIHLEMHWCMSAIDFRSKEIRYYDSMGSPNDACLESLANYLQEESLDKKKVNFDSTGWKKINVTGIPQQMNGSDCGVFACMFAEHIARDAPLKFEQENMPYFRQKMALEILEGSLIT